HTRFSRDWGSDVCSSDLIHATGGLAVLRGSLAPDGAVVKTAGFDAVVVEGRARVFDGEQAAMAAVEDGTVVAGDAVIIRYEGPRSAERRVGEGWGAGRAA